MGQAGAERVGNNTTNRHKKTVEIASCCTATPQDAQRYTGKTKHRDLHAAARTQDIVSPGA